MKTLAKIGGVLVAALMAASVAQASSSTGGAPGRSDFNKRKNTRAMKSAKPGDAVSLPKPEVLREEKAGVQGETEAKAAAQMPAPIPAPMSEADSLPVASSRDASSKDAVVPSLQNSLSAEKSSSTPRPADSARETAATPVASTQPTATIVAQPATVPVPVVQSEAPTPEPVAKPVVAVSVSTRKISYADVLTDRQKTVLKARAEDLKLKEDDYDKLLSPDEKERLDALVQERRQAMASGE